MSGFESLWIQTDISTVLRKLLDHRDLYFPMSLCWWTQLLRGEGWSAVSQNHQFHSHHFQYLTRCPVQVLIDSRVMT